MEKFKKMFATRKRKIIGVIVVLFILTVIIPSFSDQKTSSSETKTTAQITPSIPIDPAILEANKKQLADLKTKFNYKYDEFEKKGWYEAKTQNVDNTFNTQMLKVHINNVGYAYIEDQYYGDDWIFHTRIEVKIGDAIYKSEDIQSYDPNNVRTNTGGVVWETISYTGDKDNGIFKAIANSGDTVIKVRFAGDRGVKDFTLSKRDQQAIKDAYQLSDLIKKVGDNGIPKS
jgi:hypothetical protein